MKNILLSIIFIFVIFHVAFAQGDANSGNGQNDQKIVASLYPNPAIEYIDVEVKDIPSSNLQIQIFNFIGNEVDVKIQASNNDDVYRVSTIDFPQGYYWLVVMNKKSGGKHTYKFMKQ